MAEKRPAATRLVYSTRPGAVPAAGAKPCKHCDAAPCRCEPPRSLPPTEQDVRVRREHGNRGGRTVTVAAPVVLTRADADALLYTWKRLCGGGGTLRTARLPNGDPLLRDRGTGRPRRPASRRPSTAPATAPSASAAERAPPSLSEGADRRLLAAGVGWLGGGVVKWRALAAGDRSRAEALRGR